MDQSKIISDELRQALEESRDAFLGQKVTIDDISRDICSLEAELNARQATKDFIFVLEKSKVRDYSEDHLIWVTSRRELLWKKFGNRWRLFYRATYLGNDEMIYKPLIDTSKEIRLKVHPQLPAFVKGMAADWVKHRYPCYQEHMLNSAKDVSFHHSMKASPIK